MSSRFLVATIAGIEDSFRKRVGESGLTLIYATCSRPLYILAGLNLS